MRRHLALVTLLALAACGDDASTSSSSPDTAFAVDTLGADTAPPGPDCGDGVADSGEVCDEGAALNGTYGHCAVDCQGPGPYCGDGVRQAEHEACDDGPDNGDYGRCGYACQGPAIRCGNGFVEAAYEQCDDGDERNGTYGFCAADCQGPAQTCGDGDVDAPWESCDDGEDNGQPGFCPADCNPVPGCGDGERVDPEACDDGLDNGAYGKCAADCSGPGPRCGDGAVQKQEVCDDGAALNGTYGHCAVDCQGLGPRCGDGALQPADEHCDDGPENGQSGKCDVDCLAPTSAWIAQPDDLRDGVSLDGLACSDDDLLAKYMRYRRRLRGDGTAAYPGFVSVGTAPGQSIPASRRQPNESCQTWWGFGECPKPDDPDAFGFYNWGDSTVWLADYVALLALEYRMFTNLGLPVDETLSNLQLAQAAFDRVDEAAETYYDGVAPVRDGFFVRDDVPADFATLPDGGYRWPRDDGYLGYECVSADTICDPPSIFGGAFVSQDQSLSLVWAFAMVADLVPSDVIVNGVALREDAREKVHRLVWFLRSHGWKVRDPLDQQPPGAWGGDATGFSNAFAKCANRVCGDDFGVDDYRNFVSRTAGEIAWAGLQAIWELTHWYNRTHALRLAATNGDWGPSEMPRRAMSDAKDYFALTYALMHDAQLEAPWSDWRVEAILRSAPCGGPCINTAGCSETPGWQGESRNFNSGNRIGSRHLGSAEFNGIDYMATFAAYYLYRQGRWAPKPAPDTAPADCGGFRGVASLAASGAPDGHEYEPTAACAAADMAVEYCRRPWGAWLHDAYRGKVTIFAGGGRWVCEPGEPCRIVHDGATRTDGDDLILGTPGDDTLLGKGGNDCLVGFGGDDTLKGGQGYDELWGMDGADTLYGEDVLPLDGEADVLFGGPGDDFLDGNQGKDELYGEAGDDEMEGGNGDDFMLGGPGDDTMRGRGGEDHLKGEDGDDSLIGDDGADTLQGGEGRDKLDGEGGDDFLDGGYGPDFLRGGNGDDTLITGDDWAANRLDPDRACGNSGDDIIWAGWDGDECLGGGWLLGGTDEVNGCDDGTASSGDCDNGAFNSW